MDGVERPLSPHLGVYRWQITNTLSILHRATGLFLGIGALVLVCWLVALASGPAAYENVHAWYSSGWFKLPLAGWSFCLFYHLANGIRHLFWDAGAGFEPAQIRIGGWLVVVFAVVATAGYSWLAIF
jgi:succinate dehydrogenase / fumarate reductase cytochrome b subunit